jgi:hypothetical protein
VEQTSDTVEPEEGGQAMATPLPRSSSSEFSASAVPNFFPNAIVDPYITSSSSSAETPNNDRNNFAQDAALTDLDDRKAAVVTCETPSASRSLMTVERDMGRRAVVPLTTCEALMAVLLLSMRRYCIIVFIFLTIYLLFQLLCTPIQSIQPIILIDVMITNKT